MKIRIKGQLFELTITPIEEDSESVVKNIDSVNNKLINNIEEYFNEFNLFGKRIYRNDYILFKEKYDKHNVLTTKKLTIMFKHFAELNSYNFEDFNTCGKRYFVISK